MRLLDTNVLVGLLAGDGDRRDAALRVLQGAPEPHVVSESVLVETCWVLRAAYGVPNDTIARSLADLLGTEEILAWDARLAEEALEHLAARPTLGIVDCLLLARAGSGDAVVTFDRRLARAITAP
ncbi:MAG: hypothetical protein Kow0067_12940 [Coriobacteriia bacterium]|nr:PIN domain-containing protein [Anaerosomatales bacterium]